MSDDAQQRKDRAEKLRQRIRRPAPGSSGPTPPGGEPPEGEPADGEPPEGEPREGESLKDRIERRMRELDEADRKDHRPSSGDDGAP